ncbi:MAG: alpha/beta hydrolase family esterase, partial [Acidimicrobiales bacterium]
RKRPRGFWSGRVLAVLSIPIVVASTWVAVSVTWTRTHQDVEPRPTGGYPIGTWSERTFVNTNTGGAPQRWVVEAARMTIHQGGRVRSALVSRPTSIAPGVRLPVVMVVPGLGSSATTAFEEGAAGYMPAQFPSIVVIPETEWYSWNAGGCCRPATILGTDDVAFLDSIVTDMKARPDVDPARVYMWGFSNGGKMVYRYLCDHADRLAGAMSVAGTNLSGCNPDAPIDLLHVHGTKDDVMSYQGENTVLSVLFGSWHIPPAPDAIADVAGSMGCGEPPDPGPSSEAYGFRVTSIEWQGCDDGVRVRFVTYHGMGHWWPVGPPWSTLEDAPRFFGLK